MSITEGAVSRLVQNFKEGKNENIKPVLQILSIETLPVPPNSINPVRYRVILSDGSYFIQCLLAADLNGLVQADALKIHALVLVEEHIIINVQDRLFMVILKLLPLSGTPPTSRIGAPVDVDKVGTGNNGGDMGNGHVGNGKIITPTPLTSTPLYQNSNHVNGNHNSYNSNMNDNSNPYSSNTTSGAYNANNNDNSNTSINSASINNAASSLNPYGNAGFPGRGPAPMNGTSAPIVCSMATTDLPITPIAQLNMYQNKWTIKAQVVSKSDIFTVSNAKGEDLLFSVELLDHTMDIRATFFKEDVDKFYNFLKVGQVYSFSGGSLVVANMQYNTCKCIHQIIFNQQSEIHEVNDTGAISLPNYDFVQIAAIKDVEPNRTIDVLAVVKQVGDPFNIINKNTGHESKKCDLVLVDNSGAEITLTLWGEKANQAPVSFNNTPVVAFKMARVSGFNGKFLSSSGDYDVQPEVPEVQILKDWWQTTGRNNANNTRSLSSSGGVGGKMDLFADRKDICAIMNESMGLTNPDKPDYSTFKGTISHIKSSREGGACYPACANVGEPCKNMDKATQTDGDISGDSNGNGITMNGNSNNNSPHQHHQVRYYRHDMYGNYRNRTNIFFLCITMVGVGMLGGFILNSWQHRRVQTRHQNEVYCHARIESLRKELLEQQVQAKPLYNPDLQDCLNEKNETTKQYEELLQQQHRIKDRVSQRQTEIDLHLQTIHNLNDQIHRLKGENTQLVEQNQKEHLQCESQRNDLMKQYAYQKDELVMQCKSQKDELMTQYKSQHDELVMQCKSQKDELAMQYESQYKSLKKWTEQQQHQLAEHYERQIHDLQHKSQFASNISIDKASTIPNNTTSIDDNNKTNHECSCDEYEMQQFTNFSLLFDPCETCNATLALVNANSTTHNLLQLRAAIQRRALAHTLEHYGNGSSYRVQFIVSVAPIIHEQRIQYPRSRLDTYIHNKIQHYVFVIDFEHLKEMPHTVATFLDLVHYDLYRGTTLSLKRPLRSLDDDDDNVDEDVVNDGTEETAENNDEVLDSDNDNNSNFTKDDRQTIDDDDRVTQNIGSIAFVGGNVTQVVQPRRRTELLRLYTKLGYGTQPFMFHEVAPSAYCQEYSVRIIDQGPSFEILLPSIHDNYEEGIDNEQGRHKNLLIRNCAGRITEGKNALNRLFHVLNDENQIAATIDSVKLLSSKPANSTGISNVEL